MTEMQLAVSEARDVLAAVVARMARDAGLDVLLIKGPSLAAHGLRAERAWGDVDILVRPEDTARLRRELATAGWEAWNETPEYPLIALPHAITFVHPRWRTEIDAHTFLPGAYADAATTFERLWTDRASIQLAHQPVLCTGRIGSGLVAALNLARTPTNPRTRDEAVQWRTAVGSWSEADRSALAALAADCRAADVLASLFDAAGVPAIGRGALTPQEWDEWRDRVGQEAQRGYIWSTAIRRAPVRAKPGLAIRALSYDREAAMRGASQPRGWGRLRQMGRRLVAAAAVLLRRKP